MLWTLVNTVVKPVYMFLIFKEEYYNLEIIPRLPTHYAVYNGLIRGQWVEMGKI